MNCFKLRVWALVVLLSLFSYGCRKKTDSVGVIDATLSAWRQGDQNSAIQRFVDTDWSRRPLFGSSSPLAMTEKQFEALSKAEQEAKAREFGQILSDIRALALAVAKAGNDAASKKDAALTRKHFAAMQQCGDALQHLDNMAIVQLVGKAIRAISDREMAALGQ
jgi:hypothetical protein